MGTWVGHLRVAEGLLRHFMDFDCAAFFAGSLAPDSGVPNPDWTEFDPPKSVTHYLRDGTGEDRIRDLEFYQSYLLPQRQGLPNAETSFLWGYFFHLLTDRLWVDAIWETTQQENAALFTQLGMVEAVNTLKQDWYDLDHKFLRDHPAWHPWQAFSSLQLTEVPVAHIPLPAIQAQFEMIKHYYAGNDYNLNLDRCYPYLNEKTMNRFVFDCTCAIVHVHEQLGNNPNLTNLISAVELLSPQDHRAYTGPLGDPARHS